MTRNEEIFEKACAAFNDSFFEDKWADIPDNSITKSSVRYAMKRALQAVGSFRPKQPAKGSEQ